MSEAENVARALGGQRAGRGWVALCPAHDNTRTPALSISDGRDGRLLIKCHAGCAGRDVLAALAAQGVITGRGEWRQADPDEVARRRAAEDARRRQRIGAAVALWQEARPGESSPVGSYLRASRGIPLRRVPEALRFHPRAGHPKGGGLALPAMLARVDGPDGEPVGLHRTFLRPDGLGKAAVKPDKAALGPIAGGAVRLARAGSVLAVGEGIESALSFAVVARLPVWAALSTSGLRGLVLPELPRAAELVIAADRDAPGLAAAEALAERALSEGRKVWIAKPPKPGQDFNDLLREECDT